LNQNRLRVFLVCLALLSASAQSREAQIQSHLRRAAEARERQDFKVEMEEYRRVVVLDAANAEAYARLGIAYRNLGRVSESVEALERALQLDPRLPRAGVLLGLGYLALGRTPEATPHLEKAFHSEEELAMKLFVGQRLVDCYFGSSQEEKGLALIENLRKLAPDDPDVLYTAAKVYANRWNHTVERLLAKAPDSYRVHQVVAEVFEAQEKYREAAQEYRQIIRMEPQLPGVHYRLAQMILRSESSAQAEQAALAAFQKELEINPLDVPSLAEIGEISLRAQRFEEAAKHFSRALELQPSYRQARLGLGKVLLARQEFSAALKEFEEARRLAPEDETVYYNLMTVYRRLGRSGEAKTASEKFQSLKRLNEQKRQSIANKLKGIRTPPADQTQ